MRNTTIKPSDADVKAVAMRIEQSYHAITALHDLCDEAISGPSDDPITQFVVMREVLRSLARDMDACNAKLTGEETGYFNHHYGEV